MIEQISIYTENKRGAARRIFAALSEKDINILCFVNSDSGEFGTLRLIVSDTHLAMETLGSLGYLCKRTQVLAIELADHPGELERVLAKVEDMNININYMYVGYDRETGAPLIVFHSEDMDVVAGMLERAGYVVH